MIEAERIQEKGWKAWRLGSRKAEESKWCREKSS
jgi:hypothetical protein